MTVCLFKKNSTNYLQLQFCIHKFAIANIIYSMPAQFTFTTLNLCVTFRRVSTQRAAGNCTGNGVKFTTVVAGEIFTGQWGIQNCLMLF